MTPNTCKLVGATWAQDAYGVYTSAITSREVFCAVESISRSEFYDAGRNGLNPSYKVTMFAADYDGETTMTLDEKPYRIYRTYQAGDDIELYVERQGGVNGVVTSGEG